MGYAGRMITCAVFNEDRNKTKAQAVIHLPLLVYEPGFVEWRLGVGLCCNRMRHTHVAEDSAF